MDDPRMRIPGPDHPISITQQPGLVRVRFGGEVVAETSHALRLQEAAYPAVLYIPRADAKMAMLSRTLRSTHCPYKGEASYYSLRAGASQVENLVWSYEQPYKAMAEIAGHLAFYPDRGATIEIA